MSLDTPLDLQQLFSDNYKKILAYVTHHLGGHRNAEDIASDVFLIAQEKLHTYDPSKGNPQAWLYGIARFEVLRTKRSLATNRVDEYFDDWNTIAQDSADTDSNLLRQENMDELADALATLPERERDILMLRFFYDMPSKEVALKMGLSDSNVRYLQSTAISKLRKVLSGSFLK